MTESKPRSRFLPLGIALVMATPVIMTAQPKTAEADVVVRAGAHIRVRTPRLRWSWGRWFRPRRIYRPRIRVFWGAPIYVGPTYYAGPFAEPPPPPPPPPPTSDCDCGNGPAVPIRPHYRVRVAPRPPAAAIVRRPARRYSRLAIGAFGGHTKVEDGVEGEDVGLLAQFRLGRRLTLEGEIGKTSLADNARVDKRAGVALLFNLRSVFSRSRFTPYLAAGMGVSQVDMDGGDLSQGQGYGEIGGGLAFRLTRSISLSMDLRAGVRALADDDQPALVRSSATPPPRAAPDSEENYTRFRFAAMLHF